MNTNLLQASCDALSQAGNEVFQRVLRTDWSQPGFAVVILPEGTTSYELRQCMVELKEQLSLLFERKWGERLQYLSLGRFDQQTTTKLHLDGGPDRSVLMLGYEPSEVASELLIADYSACAGRMGLTPRQFLEQHNPMFPAGDTLLSADTLHLLEWAQDRCRIVVINNSSVPSDHPQFTAGVMHGARIACPDKTKSRVINSTMIAPGADEPWRTAGSVHEFLTTDSISGTISLKEFP